MSEQITNKARNFDFNRYFQYLLFAIVLGVTANLAFSFLTTDKRTLAALASFSAGHLALAILMSLVPWLTNSLRTYIWTDFLGKRFTWLEVFTIVLGADLGSAISPTAVGGGYVKLGMLIQRGLAPGAAASLMVLGSVEDAVFFALALPTAFLLTSSWQVPVIQSLLAKAHALMPVLLLAVLAGLAILGIVLMLRGRWSAKSTAKSGRMSPFIRKAKTAVRDFVEVYRLVGQTGKTRFLLTVSLTALQWTSRYSVISVLLACIHIEADPVRFFLLQWLVFTLMNFIPTPGAAVGAEAAFYFIYGGFLPKEIIGAVTVGWRFLTFYLQLSFGSLLFGLLSLAIPRDRRLDFVTKGSGHMEQTLQTIDFRAILAERTRAYFQRWPVPLRAAALRVIEKLLRASEINRVMAQHGDKQGLSFLEELFEYLDFTFLLSSKDRAKIPAEGRLICVANHPLGGLDGLAILKAISEVRPDVKMVVNDVLMHLSNLSELFLPYDVFSERSQKKNVHAIAQALRDECAVIIFPAAAVARLTWRGVRDGQWRRGAVYFAQKYEAQVLPIFIRGRNSLLFYLVSLFSKRLSMFLLPREIFKRWSKIITLSIGHPIPARTFSANLLKPKAATRLLKKHVRLIGRNKKGVFVTEKNVIHPVDRKQIQQELAHARSLSNTEDGKQVLLVDYAQAPNVVREIARLRELTFRKVGEGTGHKMDMDKYDKYYQHIVLWHNKELEIIGAYRLVMGVSVLARYGIKGLYTASLFDYDTDFFPKIAGAIELGRSFVQSRYWRSKALDQLWSGIGALLAENPQIRYLLGAVSISNAYPDDAKDALVHFCRKWFAVPESGATATNKYTTRPGRMSEWHALFTGQNAREDMQTLKIYLRNHGLSVPVLYKHYLELCEAGGVTFLDFGVDPDFSNCVDGLIWVDVAQIKWAKRDRYLLKRDATGAKSVAVEV